MTGQLTEHPSSLYLSISLSPLSCDSRPLDLVECRGHTLPRPLVPKWELTNKKTLGISIQFMEQSMSLSFFVFKRGVTYMKWYRKLQISLVFLWGHRTRNMKEVALLLLLLLLLLKKFLANLCWQSFCSGRLVSFVLRQADLKTANSFCVTTAKTTFPPPPPPPPPYGSRRKWIGHKFNFQSFKPHEIFCFCPEHTRLYTTVKYT
jgi:hypothetical protein